MFIKKISILLLMGVSLLFLVPDSDIVADNWRDCNGSRTGDGGWPSEIYCWGCQSTDICGHVPGFMCCWDNGHD